MTAYIAGYARTPFVKFTGQFATQPATVLGAHAAKAALARAGVSPEQVDQLVAGQVLQAGAGQNPARQTSVGAGISMSVPAQTINAVCLSGTEAVAQADTPGGARRGTDAGVTSPTGGATGPNTDSTSGASGS